MKKFLTMFFILICFHSIVFATDTSNLPRSDKNGVKYVTYDDFGAKCDGINDDFIAIKEAHTFANSVKCEVRATEGKKYHIFGYDGETANVATNVDWNNAKFIIHDEEIEKYPAKNKYLFTIYNSPKETIIENPNWTINKNTKKISELEGILKDLNSKGYKTYFCMAINSDKKQYIRYGADANNGDNQQDYFIIDSQANVLNDIAWNFEKITQFKIFPIQENGLEIKNGYFITNANPTINPNGTYFCRNICVLNSSNITISNITHTSTDKDADNSAYYGFIFTKNSSNINIEDCSLLTRKYAGNRSTYDLVINSSVNVYCKNIVSNDILDDSRWGIVQTAYAKDVIWENCKLNRIDAHQGIYNLTIKNCELGVKGISLIGQGTVNIIDTKVTANSFIELRYDYGSTFNGNINIINCTYKYQGVYAPKMFNFKFQYDDNENKILHDFGYVCKFPNVYMENLTIDFENVEDRKEMYIIPNFSSMLGDPYYGNSNYWAKYIHLNGYKFINNNTNAILKMTVSPLDLKPNEEYEYVVTENITARGDINRNGQFDIDDLAKLKLHLIDKKKLLVECIADLDENEKININDIAILKRKILEK